MGMLIRPRVSICPVCTSSSISMPRPLGAHCSCSAGTSHRQNHGRSVVVYRIGHGILGGVGVGRNVLPVTTGLRDGAGVDRIHILWSLLSAHGVPLLAWPLIWAELS